MAYLAYLYRFAASRDQRRHKNSRHFGYSVKSLLLEL